MLLSKIYLLDTSKMIINSRNLCIFTIGEKVSGMLNMFRCYSVKCTVDQYNCEEVS